MSKEHTIKVDSDTYKNLTMLAAREERAIKVMVRRAVERYLTDSDKGKETK